MLKVFARFLRYRFSVKLRGNYFRILFPFKDDFLVSTDGSARLSNQN